MPRSQKPRNVRLRLAINGMRGAVTLPAVMVEAPRARPATPPSSGCTPSRRSA